MKKIFLFIIILFFTHSLCAQKKLNGKVLDPQNKGIDGASVYWINTNDLVFSDSKGNFELDSVGVNDKRLVIQFIGYFTDTFSSFSKKN
ncbi:MAG: carboxypeptidase-like regulatory domain-containing protein, partial [bacterium]